jgi:uncharacterized protein
MLLDTSGLLRLHNDSEQGHEEAWDFFTAADRRLTHSYVLAEFVALANSRGLERGPALDFLLEFQDGTNAELLFVDESLHNRGLAMLRQRLDKSWSLCDAVSFVLMRERKIREALTTDHHFEQAGFVRLLKP